MIKDLQSKSNSGYDLSNLRKNIDTTIIGARCQRFAVTQMRQNSKKPAFAGFLALLSWRTRSIKMSGIALKLFSRVAMPFAWWLALFTKGASLSI